MSNEKTDFSSFTSKKLESCVDSPQNYSPEDVESAVAELESRGRIFSFAELRKIERAVTEFKRSSAGSIASEDSDQFFVGASSKQAPVNALQSDLPVYYSQSAITVFTFLFSTLFGVVLMAINLNKLSDKKGLKEVIGFGVFFFGISWLVAALFPKELELGFVLNMIGAIILNQYFWRRYIGVALYRSQSVIKPLVISMIISVAVVITILKVLKKI